MKYFEVTYLMSGKKNTIVIESEHKAEALKMFQEKAIGMMVAIQEINEPIAMRIKKYLSSLSGRQSSKRVKLEPYIASLRQLAVMLDAGIPINQSFDEVISTTDNKQLKHIFGQISLKVESGNSISEAFNDFSYELGNLSFAIISLGEQTGTLAEAVLKLSNILEEIHENRKKLKKALRYPFIVILVMVAAFVAVIKMVVPQFKSMFEEYDSELPYPTQILLNIESFFKEYGLLTLGAIFALITLHSLLYKNIERYKYFFDKWILKIYLIGKITHLSMTGRFMFVFNKLTNSGVPIIKSLAIAVNIVENSYLKNRFSYIAEAIEDGKTLTQGFEGCNQFENMIIQMVKAGESSGALNKMLEKVDGYYASKYNDIIDNISTYIEPIMIAILAAFLALMGLGIFLPMWSMTDVVGQ